MGKNQIRIPEELRREVEAAAKLNGCSEEDVLRAALDQQAPAPQPHRKPRIPLFEPGMFPPDLAENVDKYLEGFGED